MFHVSKLAISLVWQVVGVQCLIFKKSFFYFKKFSLRIHLSSFLSSFELFQSDLDLDNAESNPPGSPSWANVASQPPKVVQKSPKPKTSSQVQSASVSSYHSTSTAETNVSFTFPRRIYLHNQERRRRERKRRRRKQFLRTRSSRSQRNIWSIKYLQRLGWKSVLSVSFEIIIKRNRYRSSTV